MVEETEVYRLSADYFNNNVCYAYSYYTRIERHYVNGRYNERYYSSGPIIYLGRYIRTEYWGVRDNSGSTFFFDDNSTERSVQTDYLGTLCFIEVACLNEPDMPEQAGEAPEAESDDDEFIMEEAAAIPVVEPPMELCDMTFNCDLMIDPVKASDGITYERNDIAEWLQTHNTSPYHGLVMPDKRLTPDIEMRMRISEWQRQNPGYRGGKKSNRKSRKNNRKNIKKSARKNNRNL